LEKKYLLEVSPTFFAAFKQFSLAGLGMEGNPPLHRCQPMGPHRQFNWLEVNVHLILKMASI
jgi:hypothetical protein